MHNFPHLFSVLIQYPTSAFLNHLDLYLFDHSQCHLGHSGVRSRLDRHSWETRGDLWSGLKIVSSMHLSSTTLVQQRLLYNKVSAIALPLTHINSLSDALLPSHHAVSSHFTSLWTVTTHLCLYVSEEGLLQRLYCRAAVVVLELYYLDA